MRLQQELINSSYKSVLRKKTKLDYLIIHFQNWSYLLCLKKNLSKLQILIDSSIAFLEYCGGELKKTLNTSRYLLW